MRIEKLGDPSRFIDVPKEKEDPCAFCWVAAVWMLTEGEILWLIERATGRVRRVVGLSGSMLACCESSEVDMKRELADHAKQSN